LLIYINKFSLQQTQKGTFIFRATPFLFDLEPPYPMFHLSRKTSAAAYSPAEG
jgi:hypothetical protein